MLTAKGELISRVRAMLRRRSDYQPDILEIISGIVNADGKHRTDHRHRHFYGAHLGVGLCSGGECGLGDHFKPAKKADSS